MYKIHDWYNDTWRYFSNWWDLIGYCKGAENRIAHSTNDTYSYYDYKFNRRPNEFVDYETNLINLTKQLLLGEYDNKLYVENRQYNYIREFIVYDDWDRVVNLCDIRQGIKNFKEPKEKYRRFPYWTIRYYEKHPFVFRRDPVPGVGNGSRRKNCGKFNKSYKAKSMEYYSLFPNSGRMRELDSVWWDDGYFNKNYRCWKNKKIKKQWMKNKASL